MDPRPLPEGWTFSPEAQRPRGRLFRRLAALLGEADGRPVVIKDPRMPRLFALWEELIADLGISAAVIATHRHCAEVAGSLARRDRMSPVLAEHIWLAETAASLAAAHALPSVWLPYDRWFADPMRQTAALAALVGDGGLSPDEIVARSLSADRITSYNVCYTKLLRDICPLNTARLPFGSYNFV